MIENKNYRNHIYQLMKNSIRPTARGIAVQDGNYIGRTNDTSIPKSAQWPNLVPKLTTFAVETLHVNYIFWGAQEPFFSHDVVPTLKAP